MFPSAEICFEEGWKDCLDLVCEDRIPKLKPSQGLFVLILCIFFGGFGTIYASFLDKDKHNNPKINCRQFCIGVAQVLTYHQGYCWALMWGIKIYYRSKSKEPDDVKINTYSSKTTTALPVNTPSFQTANTPVLIPGNKIFSPLPQPIESVFTSPLQYTSRGLTVSTNTGQFKRIPQIIVSPIPVMNLNS